MALSSTKNLSCGIVILNRECEVLLCHVTGHNHWDLPKGGISPGETPVEAALRETREETGLSLAPAALSDLGRMPYSAKKDLHLFATLMPRLDVAQLYCESHYVERLSGREQPEMDGYGWFGFEHAPTLCTPKLASVLRGQIDLFALLQRLSVPQPQREPTFVA